MKICLWCQTGTEFYPSLRQPCKRCWTAEMREQRKVKGFVYNENQRKSRQQKRQLTKT